MSNPYLRDLLRSLAGLPESERKRRLAEFLRDGLAAADQRGSGANEKPWIRDALASAFYVADSPTISKRILSQISSSCFSDEASNAEDELPAGFRAIPEERVSELATSILAKVRPNAGATVPPKAISCGLDLDRIRCRGDREDLNELMQLYRIGEYLETHGPFLKNQQLHERERLLAEGIRLTAQVSPRIFGIFERISSTLGVSAETDIFCLPSAQVNASAMLLRGNGPKATACIGITSAALELLADGEIAFLLGHELGHFLFENHRMNALICTDPGNPAVTILPPLGESIFLRWRKKAELSADRIGLIACGDFHVAARALMKAAFGLSERNINLDVDALVDQIDDLVGHPNMVASAFSSHPLLPIRLKALQLFSRSQKAADAGFPAGSGSLSDNQLCDEIDGLMRLMRRHPTGRIEVAAMDAVALGGVEVLGADQEINEAEVKILIEILHRHFTDEPEQVVPTTAAAIHPGLNRALDLLKSEADTELKHFIVSRWVDIGMADGALLGKEGAKVLELAQRIGVDLSTAHAIVVGAAQAVGFKMDQKLNRAAAELKKNLLVGILPLAIKQPGILNPRKDL